MSSETLNAENRNAGLVIPVRRCCSFCRNPGHNILGCNDIRLYEFERLCIIRYRQNIMMAPEGFYNWILEYSINRPNLVKSYAVRFCISITIRHTIYACIDSIYLRIRNIVNNIDNVRQEQPTPQIPEPSLEEENSERGPENEQVLFQLEPQSNRDNSDLINLIHTRIRDANDIALALLLIDMVNRYGRNNIKYDIETKIVDCSQTEQCDCGICYEQYEKQLFVKLNCGHEFCKDCMKKTLENVRTQNPQCAFCRSEIKHMELSNESICNEFNYLINTPTEL